MTIHVLLRDTFGEGLEVFPSIGVDVCTGEKELAEYVNAAFQDLLEDYGDETVSAESYERDCGWTLGEEIVILQPVESIGGQDVSQWIRSKVQKAQDQKAEEEYKLYLELKEKFEAK